MTDYGTIKLPRDEYERHNERRQDMGLSWNEYIDGQAPERMNEREIANGIAKELSCVTSRDELPTVTGAKPEDNDD